MHSPIFPFLLTSKIKAMHSVHPRLHTYCTYADAKHTIPTHVFSSFPLYSHFLERHSATRRVRIGTHCTLRSIHATQYMVYCARFFFSSLFFLPIFPLTALLLHTVHSVLLVLRTTIFSFFFLLVLPLTALRVENGQPKNIDAKDLAVRRRLAYGKNE